MERYFLRQHFKNGLSAGRWGFTLLELLISIAIIGILISIGVVSYATAQKKSRDSRRMSDLKAVQNAFEQYYADNNGNYPDGCSLSPAYLPAGFPKDPKGGDYSNSICVTTSYCVCTALEGTTGNATANTCPPSYGSGQFFCVSNLQ